MSKAGRLKNHKWTQEEEEVLLKALEEGISVKKVQQNKFPQYAYTSIKAKMDRLKKDLEVPSRGFFYSLN